jgi:hypothetical protein
MNIPLDRLYQFIENTAEKIYGDRVIIYRFFPHGSKNIRDLNQIRHHTWFEDNTRPNVWCHDQEPLDHNYYSQHLRVLNGEFSQALIRATGENTVTNLNYNTNMFAKGVLVHSEQRSVEVEKYQAQGELIPIYYWSHAVIARDWFRYAQHVEQRKQVNRPFLIYNRAWSGTREYRLKLAEHLIQLGLHNQCQATVNPIEPELGKHYDQHQFKNPAWRPGTVLENFFPTSTAHSSYSADFDIADYETTDIEVVLETLFDDGRLHLTEKSLRPIACGQPFILAGTHLSLEYLRSYGFQTFGTIWNEHYDQCVDPEKRLTMIADLMQQIASWTPQIREQKMSEARAIAEYNRRHFFSKEFFDLVVDELQTNLTTAFDLLKTFPANQKWINLAYALLTVPELKTLIDSMENPNGLTVSNIEKALALTKDP